VTPLVPLAAQRTNSAIAVRVLSEARRLGRMTAGDFHRAADIPTIGARTLPDGRAFAAGELTALMRAHIPDVATAAPFNGGRRGIGEDRRAAPALRCENETG